MVVVKLGCGRVTCHSRVSPDLILRETGMYQQTRSLWNRNSKLVLFGGGLMVPSLVIPNSPSTSPQCAWNLLSSHLLSCDFPSQPPPTPLKLSTTSRQTEVQNKEINRPKKKTYRGRCQCGHYHRAHPQSLTPSMTTSIGRASRAR